MDPAGRTYLAFFVAMEKKSSQISSKSFKYLLFATNTK
jgi:hypothetical protein